MASVSITTHCLQINPQLILQHQVCLHAIMFLAMNINNRLNLCIVSQTLLSLSFIRDAVVMVSPPSNKTLRQDRSLTSRNVQTNQLARSGQALKLYSEKGLKCHWLAAFKLVKLSQQSLSWW